MTETTKEKLDLLNKEMGRITTLLGFIITQPQLSTSLTGIEKTHIQTMNLLKVRCVKVWADAMSKQLEKKCDKETLKGMDILFESVEVE